MTRAGRLLEIKAWFRRWLRRPSDIWRYPAALGVVAASGVVAEFLFRIMGLGGMARIFTAGVLISAFFFGVGPALLASAASFLIYTTLLTEPRVQVQPGAVEDALLLTVFLTAAVLTGGLAGRLKSELQKARARSQATSALYEASRDLSVGWEEAAMREVLATRIAAAAKGAAAIVTAGESFCWPAGTELPAGLEPPPEGASLARANGWRIRAMRSGADVLGVAAWRPDEPVDSPDESDGLIDIMVDLGAAAIGRARLVEQNAEMEALARTQQLQNALLSSISHDFRTPLASILASSSALRELGEDLTAAGRDDLLATIEEEAERLNYFVANLLSMMRLDGGALRVGAEEIDLRAVSERVAKRLAVEAQRKKVRMSVVGPTTRACGDSALLEQSLFNVVHNAVSLSPPNGKVVVEVKDEGERAGVAVCDDGPGVPPQELERIFDKFFRSYANRNRSGTGLGLSIARGLLDAMGGNIWAKNRPDARGLVVQMELPTT